MCVRLAVLDLVARLGLRVRSCHSGSCSIWQMCLVEVSSTRAAVPDGSTERVRLLGIDTPEFAHDGDAAQCGGEEAAERLAELLPEGTPVQLVSDSRADDEDRYGRLLRYVETDDGDAGATLITEGYAYAWTPDSAPDPERLGTTRTPQRTPERMLRGPGLRAQALARADEPRRK